MTISVLSSIVAPPANPIDTGPCHQGPYLLSAIGREFPQDYLEINLNYGTGAFCNREFWLLNPFSNSLQGTARWLLDGLEMIQRAGLCPYDRFPTEPGLFPWGIHAKGHAFFWLVEGAPDTWPTIVWNVDLDTWDRFELTATELLVGLLSQNIRVPVWDEDAQHALEHTFEGGEQAINAMNAEPAATRVSVELKEDTVRYVDFEYRLHCDESELFGILDLSAKEPTIQWTLQIQSRETEEHEDEDAPSCAPSMRAYFELQDGDSWRDLAGRTFDVKLGEDSESDAFVYAGYHEFAVRYSIEFIERREDKLLTRAHWDIYKPVDMYGWICVKGVVVTFAKTDDPIACASAALSKHTPLNDFGSPLERETGHVWFPVHSKHDS